MKLIHCSTDSFDRFDLSRADPREPVIWLGRPENEGELTALFGHDVAEVELSDGEVVSVDYRDHTEDGDPMYAPDVMRRLLASETGAVLRIHHMTISEYGSPTTVWAVRDVARLTIVGWLGHD